MCGLTGYFSNKVLPDQDTLLRMAQAIRHRGPDDTGQWIDSESGIGLAHCRLSIQDLSMAGHQPMVSPSGRYVIVFNGEIYNHLSIRKEITSTPRLNSQENAYWRGHSDTETLLAGIDLWGMEKTIEKSVGMFAFAVWDKKEKSLTLGRDRMGEKPLYYGWNRGTFLFSSELKAFKKFPEFNREINHNAIALYLRHNYIPAPLSIYKGIFKLWPGSLLTIQHNMISSCPWDHNGPSWGSFFQAGLSIRQYWSLATVIENGRKRPFCGTDQDAINELERKLSTAIQLQQISDVPLGAFLSGGIDSSTIAALMQVNSTRKIKTFTIGFNELKYNEAGYSKAVAQHLGTEHTELYISPQEAQAVIPHLSSIYDEPFSDSSQIPTFLVSQMAKQHVTVTLSGDAGDELFGGYDRYFKTSSLLKKIRIFPYPVRKIISKGLETFQTQMLKPPGLPSIDGFKSNPVNRRIAAISEIFACKNNTELYQRMVSHWKKPADIVLHTQEPYSIFQNKGDFTSENDFNLHMMFLDTLNYLPDDILVKVDRAAMAVSLETRVPFLDQHVVEFAWQLPLSYKIRNNQGKWILRQVLDKYVPRKLIERPKMGFGVPIDSWLRGPLRDWAESLLNEKRLIHENIFTPEPIRHKWIEHLSGTQDWHYYLWDILIFQSWFENERTIH